MKQFVASSDPALAFVMQSITNLTLPTPTTMSKKATAAKKAAPAKKPAAKKAATKTATPAPPTPPAKPQPAPEVKLGDKVNYVLTAHDATRTQRAAGSTLAMKVDQFRKTGEVVLSAKVGTLGMWRRGAFYSAGKEPGTWHK